MYEDFEKQFKLPFSDFSAPIKWQDAIGFSVIKKYPNGYASLYRIGIGKQCARNNLKNLILGASYGKESSGGISVGSGNKGFLSPVDIDFSDEYFYEESTQKFFHHKKEIEAQKVLLNLEKIHELPTRRIKGILLRMRLRFWRKLIPSFIIGFDKIIAFVLLIVSGEKPTELDILKRLVSQWHEGYFERANQKPQPRTLPFVPVSFNKGTPLNFFGYQAKRWSVVFYCLINLSLYVFFFYLKTKPIWITYISDPFSNILRNSFLALCYVVVSFAITEALVPSALKKMIETMPKIFNGFSFKILKVHSFW